MPVLRPPNPVTIASSMMACHLGCAVAEATNKAHVNF